MGFNGIECLSNGYSIIIDHENSRFAAETNPPTPIYRIYVTLTWINIIYSGKSSF